MSVSSLLGRFRSTKGAPGGVYIRDDGTDAAATFTTPGVHHWTVPPGWTRARVLVVSGGEDGQPGRGGEAGEARSLTRDVKPGDVLRVVVGAAGELSSVEPV